MTPSIVHGKPSVMRNLLNQNCSLQCWHDILRRASPSAWRDVDMLATISMRQRYARPQPFRSLFFPSISGRDTLNQLPQLPESARMNCRSATASFVFGVSPPEGCPWKRLLFESRQEKSEQQKAAKNDADNPPPSPGDVPTHDFIQD